MKRFLLKRLLCVPNKFVTCQKWKHNTTTNLGTLCSQPRQWNTCTWTPDTLMWHCYSLPQGTFLAGHSISCFIHLLCCWCPRYKPRVQKRRQFIRYEQRRTMSTPAGCWFLHLISQCICCCFLKISNLRNWSLANQHQRS